MNQIVGRVIVGLLFLSTGVEMNVCFAGNETSELIAKDLSAKEILINMAVVYKTCKSYSDSGLVKTIFFKKMVNI